MGEEPGYQAGAVVPSGGAVPATDSYAGQAPKTGHARPACWCPLSGKVCATSAWPVQGADNSQGAIGTTVFLEKREKGMWARREWLATPVFLPGEFHGQTSLAGCSLQGRKESDTTE